MTFVIIPAAIILVVAAIVLSGSDRSRRTRRYRPGRPYDFQPIWFLASPERVTGAADDSGQHARAIEGQHARAIEGPILEDSTGHRVLPGPVGGASDSW